MTYAVKLSRAEMRPISARYLVPKYPRKYSGTQITYKPSKQAPKEKVIILTRKDILARVKQVSESTNIQVKG